MNSYQASLSNLFKAEEEANTIIKRAEEEREQLLELAIQDANSEIEKLRQEEEQKFAEKAQENQNNFEDLEKETNETKKVSMSDFDKNKEKVVEFLLERIVNVGLDLQRNVKGDFHLNYQNER